MKKPRWMTGLRYVQAGNLGLRGLGRLNHYVAAVAAFVDELDGAGDFGEKSVIFAASDVCARLERCTTLANDDGAARDELTTECFNAKPLRVGIAPVSGTA